MEMTEQTNAINPFEGWTTIEDAARITGRQRMTILNWAHRGYIACYRIGPKIEVVNLEELIAFSESRPVYNKKQMLDKTPEVE